MSNTELEEVMGSIEEEKQETSSTLREMQRNLIPIKTALTSKELQLDNAPYLQLFVKDNKIWYGARTSRLDMFMPVAPNTGLSQSANIDFNSLDRVLRVMDGEVTIETSDNSVRIADNKAQVRLTNYVVDDSIEIDEAELSNKIQHVKANGHEVDKSELIKVLSFLTNVVSDDTNDIYDFLGSVSFTKDQAYLLESKYMVVTTYTSPFDYMLSHTESVLLLNFLRATTGDVKMLEVGETEVHVVSGDSIMVLLDVEKNTPVDALQRVTGFETQETITLEKSELMRYLKLSTIFIDKYGEDIDCIVEDGQGTIGEDDPDKGGSRGYFDAEGVNDFGIKLSALSLLKILSNIPDGEELFTLKVHIDNEEAYFQYGNVESILSIISH